YSGSATLVVFIDDQGNTGSGGAKTDLKSVNISVKPPVTKPGPPPIGTISIIGTTLVAPPIDNTCPASPGGGSAGGLVGNLGKAVSAGPVRYADGTVVLNQTDLAS